MTFERYDGKGDFWNPQTTDYLIRNMDAVFTFERTGAQEWINEFRVETNGALDIDATADKIGIPVVRGLPVLDGKKVFAHGLTTGLGEMRGKSSLAIYLEDEYDKDHTLTYGHELGHVFLDTAAGLNPSARGGKVEDFCEQFGRQVAVPVQELGDLSVITADVIFNLMNIFNVGHSTVIHQLMLAGKLPHRFIMDTSNPVTPVAMYSEKVNRHTFCHDCATGRNHTVEPLLENVPILDCSAYVWSYSTEHIPCGTENHRSGDDAFAELNRFYGRWTDKDQADLLSKSNEQSKRKLDDLFAVIASELGILDN